MAKEIAIGDFLYRIKRPIELKPTKLYKLVTVKLAHKGVVLREEKQGRAINSKMYEVKKGDFILSGIDARNGAFGIVPKELDNAIVTNDFWYFDIDEKIVDKHFFLELTATKWFDEICRKGSDGTTQRIRLQKSKFFKQEVTIPSIDEQKKLIEKFQSFKPNRTALQSELAHQQTLLKKLRQQVLQEAIEGKLTADWRTRHSPPVEGWQAKPSGVVSRAAINYFNLPYNPALRQRAKELRKAGNLSEVLFWKQVRNKQFKDLDFDRQKIIGNYITDFYCPSLQTVIEIDGSSHDNKQEYDRKRDKYLQGLGLTVIHIMDSDVKKNIAGVMRWLGKHGAFTPARLAGALSRGRTTPSSLRDATPPEEGNCESVGALLERVRVERERLVKDKKIKRQRALPPISEDEKPFELPKGWEWCRLGELCSKTGSGSTPSGGKSAYIAEGIKFIRSQNVYNNGLRWNKEAHIPQVIHDQMSGTKLLPNDLLLNITGGSIGRCCILSSDFDSGNINQHIAIIRLVFTNLTSYFHKVICSNFFQNEIITVQTGSGREGLPKNRMDNMLVPLPPLSEQKAIVTKVEKLLALCDQLKTQITQNQNHAKALMQAVLKEAFAHSSEPVE